MVQKTVGNLSFLTDGDEKNIYVKDGNWYFQGVNTGIRSGDTTYPESTNTRYDGTDFVYNAKRFGAKGDGITDDSQVIQQMIDNAHGSGGGTIFFPSGEYNITKALTVYEGINLIGASETTVTIVQKTQQNHISAKDANYVMIKNITFEGPGMDAGWGGGIDFGRQNNDNVMGSVFENVTIQHCVNVGLRINCPILSTFTNVRCLGIVGNGFSFYSGGTSVTMNGCYAVTCTQAGFDLNQINYSTLNGCASEVCGIGYYLRVCNNLTLSGCGAEDQIPRNTTEGIEYKGVDFQLDGGNWQFVNFLLFQKQ